ncbi:esterase 1 [Mycena maculata]|uniref:Esterase 1 n=1 Tax=Mycena maculata TaxID=230809 RepID=A0AAD7HEY4_9AGAR|nr:esterase 1 [Mycena maculata]
MTIIFLLSILSCAIATTPTVNLRGTVLYGSDNVPGQEFFGGIPYVEPPVGNLRFRLPVLKTSLGLETFNATEYSPACLQVPLVEVKVVSEDCLTVNVIRPTKIATRELLPVLVWVHGGGFDFNASGLVTQSVSRGTPIVFASFNYRLGPLGFAPGQEAADAGILNLGLRDAMMAFRWIQDNIAIFGGDPTKVTAYGLSAGSITLAELFLNPEMEKFTRGMIFSSGPPSAPPMWNASHRQVDWDNFVRAVPQCQSTLDNATSLDCLRTVNSSALLDAINVATGKADEQFPWVPTIDGPGGIIPESPSQLLQAGNFAHIPFIAGAAIDEGTGFVPPFTNSTEMIKDSLFSNFSASEATSPALEAAVDQILALYPDIPALGCPYNTGNETFGLDSQFKRFAAIVGDIFWIGQRRALNQIASEKGVRSFGYVFDDLPAPNVFPPFLGVFHAVDVNYTFGALASLNGSAAAVHLGKQMVDYWLSFATSLDPNDEHGSKRPLWPHYTTENQVIMQFNSTNLTVIPDDFRAEQISFINSNSVVFRH